MKSVQPSAPSPTARPPATLLLLRHAETDAIGTRLTGRLSGIDLNATGVRQAARLARRLAAVRLSAIYSSPLLRARATADAIAAQVDVEVRIDVALTEIDFGEWTGLTLDELAVREDWHRYNTARSTAAVPGGESPRAAADRIASALDRLRARHRGETIAIVTHTELIRYAVLQSRGRSLDDWPDVDVPPASVSVFADRPAPLRLDELNKEATRQNA